jgi:hypothetical protein
LGGPLADLAKLIGEVVGVYDAPIQFNFTEGRGTIRVADVVAAEMQPYADSQGRPTKMVDSIFSTIPGSPAHLGKAPKHKVNLPQHNMSWEFTNRNAILGQVQARRVESQRNRPLIRAIRTADDASLVPSLSRIARHPDVGGACGVGCLAVPRIAEPPGDRGDRRLPDHPFVVFVI